MSALENEAKVYVCACWVYYHALGDVESPLTDAEFDQLQETLAKRWQETPQWFKARCPDPKTLKTDAHSIKLSDDEKSAALAWANGDPLTL
jgi:hypothetical protein